MSGTQQDTAEQDNTEQDDTGQDKAGQDRDRDDVLEGSFPASDPPAIGGSTGPDDRPAKAS